MLQNQVLSFQIVLLSPNVINYCMEHCVKSWEMIVIYTHFLLRCFSLHKKSSVICLLPASDAGWKLVTAELSAQKGMEEAAVPWDSWLRCGKTFRSHSKWEPPLFSSHTESITINGDWCNWKKNQKNPKKPRKQKQKTKRSNIVTSSSSIPRVPLQLRQLLFWELLCY